MEILLNQSGNFGSSYGGADSGACILHYAPLQLDVPHYYRCRQALCSGHFANTAPQATETAYEKQLLFAQTEIVSGGEALAQCNRRSRPGGLQIIYVCGRNPNRAIPVTKYKGAHMLLVRHMDTSSTRWCQTNKHC